MTMRVQGGCLCGAVRYVARGEPLNQRVCHCGLCQKAIGAAFNARMLYRIADVEIAGPVGTFNSSTELAREFCPTCGTTLFSRREGAGVIGLMSGSLDDAAQFRPTMHIWTSARQPWVTLDDGLPQYPEGPPA